MPIRSLRQTVVVCVVLAWVLGGGGGCIPPTVPFADGGSHTIQKPLNAFVNVSNVGCRFGTACPAPGAATTATLVSGGAVVAIGVSQTSSVAISGGTVSGFIAATDASTIRIFGTGFTLDGVAVPFGPLTAESGELAGTLLAGDPLRVSIVGHAPTATILLAQNPECSDGIDNDGDGAIDFPADTLCQAAWDDDEAFNPPVPACGLLGIEPLALAAWALARRRRSRTESGAQTLRASKHGPGVPGR
jgi:hypothetical protein